MSFLKPDPPTPPNPIDTARASTGTNVSTAVANAFLNNVNQVTPTGNVSYNPTGSYSWTDPTTNTAYNIPTFTATQTLSPQQEAIQNQREGSQLNLATMGNQQSQRVENLLSSNLDTGASPYAGQVDWLNNVAPIATSYSSGGPIQSGIGGFGNIVNSYGPADDFSADRQRVEDSLMARMNPQLKIQQQALQQQLADQGIRYGSQAYTDAMNTYNMQANDARWGAIQQAGQEQQRMTEEAQQQATFQNAAQQQGYEQILGQGQFANQAQQQQYNQNAALAQFNNLGSAQQLQWHQAAFNAANAQRNQWMQEQFALRNQPINEITSLLSGSQVSQPNFVQTPGSQIATTDIAGIINNNFNQQLANYQQQSQNVNSLVGGVLGLGAGALKGGYLSDVREKENIEHIGTVFSAKNVDKDDRMGSVLAEKAELPIYKYSYKKDPASVTHVGPMAQDVEKIDPGAVHTVKGRKYIEPERVMGNILRAA
jgi:hypothetical protein